jgi:hypothetical protein
MTDKQQEALRAVKKACDVLSGMASTFNEFQLRSYTSLIRQTLTDKIVHDFHEAFTGIGDDVCIPIDSVLELARAGS